MALRITLFGQAAFGKDVLEGLVAAGHAIVGVYTPPESGRPDPLAEAARAHGLPLFQHRFFRRRTPAGGFEPIPRILDEYRALATDLNVLAYVTAILPPEIVQAPRLRSLCFHPSLLPKYRGGAALAWQIIEGEREAGVSVFEPDAGVDSGPIVVQKGGVAIEPHDSAASLYFEKLYPLGVAATIEAVDLVASGRARPRTQDESAASFQGLVGEAESRIDWSLPARRIDRLIRGCDPQPGAWTLRGGEVLRCFDARLASDADAGAAPGTLLGFDAGALRVAAAGGVLRIGRVRLGGGAKLAAAEAGLVAGERLGA